MAKPAYNLPEGDQPDIRPNLRALEGGGEGDGIPHGDLQSVPDNSPQDSSTSSIDDPKAEQHESNTQERDRSLDKEQLADKESSTEGGGSSPFNFNPGDVGGLTRLKNMLWGSKRRKQATVSGGTAGAIITAVMVMMGLSSGPLQLIHLAQVLEKNFHHSESLTAKRSKGLFRYARSNGDIGETRVGVVGSRVFSKTIAQLKDIGIEFTRNSLTGRPDTVKIDTNKLSERYPELKTMSPAKRASFLADTFSTSKFNLTADQFVRAGNSDVFSIDASTMGFKQVKAIKGSTLSTLDDGAVTTWIKARVMSKFFDIPSLFHPFKKLTDATKQDLATAAARKAEEEKRAKATEPTPTPEEVAAEENLKGQVKGWQGKAAGALLLTAVACIARSVADDVPKVNYAAGVAPAVVDSVDKQAAGSQLQAAQDVSIEEPAAVSESFIDSNGKTIWAGKALQVTEGVENPNGEDLPPEYAQAFSKDTTASAIKNTLGGGFLGGLACSPVGQAVQILGTIGVLISGFADFGGSWGAYAAVKGTEAAATAGAISMIQHEAVKLLSSKVIIPEVLSGPLGGNILAYGAREAANIEARAAGGVILSGTEAATLDKQSEEQDKKQFASKTLFARMFDVHDYRSLASRVIDGSDPNMAQGASHFATGLLNFSNVFHSLSTIFTPHILAASQPYNWGFPQYGIPDNIANNPDYEDPYANADAVAALLDGSSGGDYVDKAKACFGVDISKDSDGKWNAVATSYIIPTDDSYLSKNCSSTDDPNWQHIMLFIFDTRTMNAIACYNGQDEAEQACNDVGYGAPSQTSDVSTSTAGSTIDSTNLYQDSSKVACAPGTKDLGIQDGYSDGNKVEIRICAVPNLPSTGEESNGGYGVSGADGHAVVNSRVSGAVFAMVHAAAQDGVKLTAISSFRTMAHQQALCPCDGVTVAKPGYSNHQMGLAIDFGGGLPSTPGPISGNQFWDWLSASAGKFGYKNYEREAWHWSPTGN